jgi:thioredoxin 1
MMAPVLEELAGEYQGRATIAKLNVDENPDLASQYGVMSIPNMVLFKGGQDVDRVVGVVSKEVLKGRLDALLS